MKKIIYKPTGCVLEFRWRTFHEYYDRGHGWLKVPYSALYRLGLLDKITPFSFLSKTWNYVFLEEDVDAQLFFRTLTEIGCPYKIVSHYTDRLSKIRKYQSFDKYMVRSGKVEVEFV